MEWFIHTFRVNPELALFLALAIGFGIGKLKLRQFELGAVTGTLLAGLLIGQLRIVIDPTIRSLFFLMFLFAIGYSVGPQFVRGLKKDGLPQLLFSVLQCTMSLAVVYVIGRIMHYDLGQAAGVLAGSHTVTGALGVAADTISGLPLGASEKAAMVNRIPVAYAITYIFGTVGGAWFLASLGPKILGVNLVEECRKLEAASPTQLSDVDFLSLVEQFDLRAYRVDNERYVGKSVEEFETLFGEARVFVENLRRLGQLAPVELTTVLKQGDILGVMARREMHVSGALAIGPEVDDHALLGAPTEVVDIVITNDQVAGQTIRAVAMSKVGRQQARGVYLRKMIRGGIEIPISLDMVLDRGDVLQMIGSKENVARVADYLGYADRATSMTDMVFVGSGIVIGGLVGAIAIKVNGVSFGLSTSVGVLIAGLLFGWLRSVKRTFGRIPAPALWILRNLGLTTFIAALGISVGPSFVEGIKQAGVSLFVAGIFATILPLLFGLLMGKYIFKFHPAITLGAAAGAQTGSAALAMIQDAAQSKAPVLGYSVPYALGNILLTLWGLVIVLLMS